MKKFFPYSLVRCGMERRTDEADSERKSAQTVEKLGLPRAGENKIRKSKVCKTYLSSAGIIEKPALLPVFRENVPYRTYVRQREHFHEIYLRFSTSAQRVDFIDTLDRSTIRVGWFFVSVFSLKKSAFSPF